MNAGIISTFNSYRLRGYATQTRHEVALMWRQGPILNAESPIGNPEELIDLEPGLVQPPGDVLLALRSAPLIAT